jgi:serine/threonine protein kinase
LLVEPEPQTKVLPPSHTDATNVAPGDSMATTRALGRYEVVQRLGHGGMATVYLGRATGNAGFEKLVAIKVIHPHLAAEPEFVEMFLEEARIAAKIQSPHVAGILDLGHEDGLHFMVMEYIDGETLSGLIRQLRPRDERLPLPVVLRILIDACEGLTAVHDLCDADGHPYGLVHRDMSPQNLMIGFDGWTKIVDFGLVKATGKRHTQTGHLRGKLAYMSPEQARGKPITATADLFALGVVFWELLTGKRLFAGESDAETLDRVVRCELPPLRTHRDDLPPDIEPILRRALAREPADRYTSADAMLADLRRSLRDHLGPEDPRKQLAAIMRQHFEEQHKYRIAALRGASRGAGRPRMHLVQRTPSASQPAIERSNHDSSLTLVAANDDDTRTPEDGLAPAEPRRPVSGGNLVVAAGIEDSAARTLSQGPGRHWLWWLVLPMFGATLAVAILLTVFNWRDDAGRDRLTDAFRPETPIPSVTPAGAVPRAAGAAGPHRLEPRVRAPGRPGQHPRRPAGRRRRARAPARRPGHPPSASRSPTTDTAASRSCSPGPATRSTAAA